MTKILAIDAELSIPPSSPTCFRDVSLYGKIYHWNILAISPKDWQDSYNTWFANHGIWDYVDDIITPEEMAKENIEIHIIGGIDGRLNAFNLWKVLRALN